MSNIKALKHKKINFGKNIFEVFNKATKINIYYGNTKVNTWVTLSLLYYKIW